MAGRKGVAALVAAGALACAPAGASAAVVQGGGADPAGDGAGGARDVVAVAATYDDAGAIAVRVDLAAAPIQATDAQVTAMIGTLQGTTCVPAAAVGGRTFAGPAVWVDSRSDTGLGTFQRDGAAVTYAGSAPTLAVGPRDCVLINLVDPSNVRTVYDIAGPYPLAPVPPPQPQPQPQPQPPTERPGPGPVERAKPVRRAPRLALPASAGSKPLPRNRWTRATVTVRNSGTATARRVALQIGAAPGVAIRPRRATARSLRPGQTLRARIQLKASSRAKATTKLSLRASGAAKLSARGTLTVRFATPKPRARPRPTRPAPGATRPGGDDLAGRYFWRFESRVDYAWDNSGVAFLGGGWAYRGLPEGGLPRCTRVTATRDGDGCVRYAYNAKSGALTVGGETGWWRRGDLKIGSDDDYRELQVPRPGSRYGVELIHRGFSGYCGFITGCTTWSEWLTLRADGNFALSSMTIGSMGGGGAPFTAAWNAPPDKYGRYEVLSGARLKLSYADGRVVFKTIGIELRRGRPDAKGEGLLLNDTNFYPDSD